jgi:hypothetical protein
VLDVDRVGQTELRTARSLPAAVCRRVLNARPSRTGASYGNDPLLSDQRKPAGLTCARVHQTRDGKRRDMLKLARAANAIQRQRGECRSAVASERRPHGCTGARRAIMFAVDSNELAFTVQYIQPHDLSTACELPRARTAACHSKALLRRYQLVG